MLFYIIATIAVFYLGRLWPTKKIRRELKNEGARVAIEEQFTDTTWKCIDVIQDPIGGLWGTPVQKIILERHQNRLTFCYMDKDIAKDSQVILKPRRSPRKWNCWFGIVDEFMSPQPL